MAHIAISQRAALNTRSAAAATRLSVGPSVRLPLPLAARQPLRAFRAVVFAEGGKVAGTVKWFNSTKGFGFITPNNGGEDLFVHQTSIITDGFRSLAEGEEVEFFIEQSDDGRTKATQVTGPNGAPPQGQERDFQGGGGGRRDYGGGGGGGNYGAAGGRGGGGGGRRGRDDYGDDSYAGGGGGGGGGGNYY